MAQRYNGKYQPPTRIPIWKLKGPKTRQSFWSGLILPTAVCKESTQQEPSSTHDRRAYDAYYLHI